MIENLDTRATVIHVARHLDDSHHLPPFAFERWAQANVIGNVRRLLPNVEEQSYERSRANLIGRVVTFFQNSVDKDRVRKKCGNLEDMDLIYVALQTEQEKKEHTSALATGLVAVALSTPISLGTAFTAGLYAAAAIGGVMWGAGALRALWPGNSYVQRENRIEKLLDYYTDNSKLPSEEHKQRHESALTQGAGPT